MEASLAIHARPSRLYWASIGLFIIKEGHCIVNEIKNGFQDCRIEQLAELFSLGINGVLVPWGLMLLRKVDV